MPNLLMSLAKRSQTSSHEAVADSLQLVCGVTHAISKKVQALFQKIKSHFLSKLLHFATRCCGFS